MKTMPDLKSIASLSPFELKDILIKAASSSSEHVMLNAGRGNPNFLATEPRHGFFQFGLFGMTEAEQSFVYMPEGVGGFPRREGIEGRFNIFTAARKGTPGISFIRSAVSYVRDQLGLSAPDVIYEMCEAILGCMYPVPDRMLPLSEKIVGQYIREEMIGTHPFKGGFGMYAVEGGTAAMTYLFNTLKENHLLKAGDSIALGMPIFTPYIEIPELADYQLTEVLISADPAGLKFIDRLVADSRTVALNHTAGLATPETTTRNSRPRKRAKRSSETPAATKSTPLRRNGGRPRTARRA